MSNNKYKILVVEDDQNISSMIQTILETSGYQVLLAQRCQQGILMLTSHVPDLVVLDLGLPDMDGEEFIRTARSSSGIPIPKGTLVKVDRIEGVKVFVTPVEIPVNV